MELNDVKRWMVTLAIVNTLLLGFILGYFAPPVDIQLGGRETITTPEVQTPTPTPAAGDRIEYRQTEPVSGGWDNWRTSGQRVDSVVLQLDGASVSDPTILRGPDNDTFYLFVNDHGGEGMDRFRADNPEGPWTLEANDAVSVTFLDVIRGPNGRYIALGSGNILTSYNLKNWTDHGPPISKPVGEAGLLYDPATETYHMYYSNVLIGASDCCSTYNIGHASSTDGLNFTRNPSNPIERTQFKTGDFDPVKVDGRYHLFADNDSTHPEYNIRHWSGTSPANFSAAEDVIHPQGWCDVGIGDPDLIHHSGTWYAYYECWGHPAPKTAMGIGYATSPGPEQSPVTE